MTPPSSRERIELLPLDEADRVDQLCDAFEAGWKRGERPRLESLLDALPEGPARPVLLRELLALELEFRAAVGEQPDPNDYHARFPDQAPLIHHVFQDARQPVPPLARESTATDSDANTASGTAYPDGPIAWSDADFTQVHDAPDGISDSNLPSGHWLGPYQIIERIGVGGMGVVYRAWQKNADRIVALKLIKPRWNQDGSTELADERTEQQFLQEARAAARLNHDHIVTVFDVGRADGRYYYSMRFLGGQSLAKVLEAGPLSPRRAASYLRDVAQAIHHAHQQGILHRDLKPANILIDDRDRPYVLDFGLAKLLAGPGESAGVCRGGTLAYMSPEQARGAADVGVASDVYNLGATLFELLTGRPPFQSAHQAAILRQIIEDEPVPPRALNRAIPRDLETICLACLEKKPGDRYASAAELANELERFLEFQPIERRRPWFWERFAKQTRRRPALTLLAAVALVALLVLAAMGWSYHQTQRQASQALVNRLVEAPVSEAPTLAAALRAYRASSRPQLVRVLRAEPVPPDLRLKVGLALLETDPRWLPYLVNRLVRANSDEHRAILRVVEDVGHRQDVAIQLRALLETNSRDEPLRLRATSALIALDDGTLSPPGLAEIAWDALRHRPDDTLRSELIEWIEQTEVPPHLLLRRLRSEPDATVRQALIQALGNPHQGPPRPTLPPSVQDELRRRYREDPDPGVHGSLAALFRSWNQADVVDELDQELIGPPQPSRSWFVNSQGQTFAILPGQRDDDGPGPHVAIRPFAIALTETTVAQFLRLVPEGSAQDGRAEGQLTHPIPDEVPDAAVCHVSYYDAMRYCRRLNEAEHVPAEEIPYPPWEAIRVGLIPPPDASSKQGWRLPTVDEWEYACQAGTTTRCYFGRSEALAPQYAWCNGPAGGLLHPVGRLRPNTFGLLDLLGNAEEWCDNSPVWPLRTCPFEIHPGVDCGCGPVVAFRGCNIATPAAWLHTKPSPEFGQQRAKPTYSYSFVGFRVVRTMD